MMNGPARAFLYGSGVFTTIRLIDGKPWLGEKHWRRLEHDATKLGIDISQYSESMVRRGLDESIPDADKLDALKARITITDERPSPHWSDVTPQVPTNVTFLVSPLRIVPRPFKLGVSPHLINSTSPIAGLKTWNYLEQTLSQAEAKSRGLREAIRVNEHGHITSACMANVFWLKGDEVFAPALATGCLPGTTREFVMENLAVREIEAEIGELQDADAIFLTSAGLGVVSVDEFDGRALAPTRHPILKLVPD